MKCRTFALPATSLRRRVRAFSVTASRRSAHTANPFCFSPEGFLRNISRAGTGLTLNDEYDHRDRNLFLDLVARAVRGVALGGSQSGRKRRGYAGHRSRSAGNTPGVAKIGLDHRCGYRSFWNSLRRLHARTDSVRFPDRDLQSTASLINASQKKSRARSPLFDFCILCPSNYSYPGVGCGSRARTYFISLNLDRKYGTGLAPRLRSYGLGRRYPIVESVSAHL